MATFAQVVGVVPTRPFGQVGAAEPQIGCIAPPRRTVRKMPERREPNANVYGVATILRIDSATAEVLRAFGAAGISCLVLKGPAIAGWLYDAAEPRYYVDSDMLVCPDDIAHAEHVLGQLGFVKRFDDSRMPDWWREHAGEWVRETDGVPLDLHRALPGVGVDERKAWSVLAAETDTIEIAGQDAPVLAIPARSLHIVLHAAQHGEASGRPLSDLERAIAQLEESAWRDAVHLAARLEATHALSAGLRLTPSGRDLASRLGLPAPGSVAATLAAGSAPPVALGIEQLVRARGVRARAAILWHKLFPPAEFVRHWQPVGTESRLGLARAYVRRPFWILRQLPRALQTWLGARRRVRRGDS
jgi:hypothetical protein